MKENNIQNIIKTLEQTVRNCGEIIRSNAGNIDHTVKATAHDLLTHLDGEIEQIIIKAIKEVDPETPVIGEESGGDRSAKKYWLVDPIDGTIHFVRGMPFNTIMISLIEEDIPILGIIYCVESKDYYYAIKGFGAYKNGQPINTSKRNINESLFFTEINTSKNKNFETLQRIRSNAKVMDLVCAGFEFMMVADGRVEARICLDPYGKDYDFASGVILVQEAGGVVKNLKGKDYTVKDNNFIVASSLDLYYNIANIIKG